MPALVQPAKIKGGVRQICAFHSGGNCYYATGNTSVAERYFGTALSLHPAPPLKSAILSRFARTSAITNKNAMAIVYLDSAFTYGYIAFKELDTRKDFQDIRGEKDFVAIRQKTFNSLYPCANNPHDKEFDFWIGEWDAYMTGSNTVVGHSVIQRISGGCAILENWTSAASEGKSLNFIDDSTNNWKQVWVGSYANRKQDFTGGVYSDSAMRCRFTTKDAQGHLLEGRLSFVNKGPSQVRQLN